jgi:hypothetical protein
VLAIIFIQCVLLRITSKVDIPSRQLDLPTMV